MKLRNLKMNESIEKQYEHALENDHTILEPTEANALEMEKTRKEQIKDDFKEQDKTVDEVAKATNATEVNEPKKVKDRKELSVLLAEAKEAGNKWRISRCNEEGYRYLFETYKVEGNLEEAKSKKYYFSVYEIDENGDEVDSAINSFNSFEEAKEFALNQPVSTHIVYVPNFDPDENPDSVNQGEYSDFEVIWSSLDETLKDTKDKEESLTEADEPAAESIENCQKWVDYDMEHYGDVSKNTQEIIKKAGYQIIKDDHGDYEVAAGKFEELGEKLDFDDQDELTHDLYNALKGVVRKYLGKGVDSDDLESAFEFCIVHAEDDEEFPDDFFKNPTWGKKEEVKEVSDIEVKEDKVEDTNESLTEADGKKSVKTVLNDCQSEWGVATSPDQMRSLIIKCLDDHKDEITESEYKYARMVFERAARNAIFGLVAAFTTGMAMNPNKEHKQNVKDLETESLDETSNEDKVEDKEKIIEDEDEKPFEEEKVEYEIDDEFDWKY